MEPILIAGGVVVLIWWLTRGKKDGDGLVIGGDPASLPPSGPGDTNIDKPPARTPPPPDDSTGIGDLLGKAKDAAGKIGAAIGATPPPPPSNEGVPIGTLPITPEPGKSPANPIPWTSLEPGFEGYFLISEGATLSKCAQKIGIGGTKWRSIRDHIENQWARDQCPMKYRHPPYVVIDGEKNIALIANYGKVSGVDCAQGAPGWKAELYSTTPLTGQFPVLYWGP